MLYETMSMTWGFSSKEPYKSYLKTIYVNYDEYNVKYNKRDSEARDNMKKLIDSDSNKVEKVFSTLLER